MSGDTIFDFPAVLSALHDCVYTTPGIFLRVVSFSATPKSNIFDVSVCCFLIDRSGILTEVPRSQMTLVLIWSESTGMLRIGRYFNFGKPNSRGQPRHFLQELSEQFNFREHEHLSKFLVTLCPKTQQVVAEVVATVPISSIILPRPSTDQTWLLTYLESVLRRFYYEIEIILEEIAPVADRRAATTSQLTGDVPDHKTPVH